VCTAHPTINCAKQSQRAGYRLWAGGGRRWGSGCGLQPTAYSLRLSCETKPTLRAGDPCDCGLRIEEIGDAWRNKANRQGGTIANDCADRDLAVDGRECETKPTAGQGPAGSCLLTLLPSIGRSPHPSASSAVGDQLSAASSRLSAGNLRLSAFIGGFNGF
jgi:hypothetical protein